MTGLPVIEGAVFDSGAIAFVTTAVGCEFAVCDPSELDAVTRASIVCPTSAFVSVYVFSVSPLTLAQLLPFESHRIHWYLYEVGAFFHEPVLVVSVLPTIGVP